MGAALNLIVRKPGNILNAGNWKCFMHLGAIFPIPSSHPSSCTEYIKYGVYRIHASTETKSAEMIWSLLDWKLHVHPRHQIRFVRVAGLCRNNYDRNCEQTLRAWGAARHDPKQLHLFLVALCELDERVFAKMNENNSYDSCVAFGTILGGSFSDGAV